MIREFLYRVASALQAPLQAIDQTLDLIGYLVRPPDPSAAIVVVPRPPYQRPWSMLLFGQDLLPAKQALLATPSRRDQLLLVECDRSPCGNDAVTSSIEQQDWSRRVPSRVAAGNEQSGPMAHPPGSPGH